MSSSSHEHFLQRSVVKDTKEKFDGILKKALKDSSQSHSSLKDVETGGSSYTVHNFIDPSEEEKKEFILNKFFEKSDSLHAVNEIKPIPKPRTKFKSNNQNDPTLSPKSSNETFKVVSPKVVSDYSNKDQSKVSSASSTNTYKVSSPKFLNTQNDESSSQRTFRISKKEPKIGDIIIHEKHSVSQIVDVQVENETSHLKETSEIRSNSSESRKISGDENVTDQKEMNGSVKDERKDDSLQVVGDIVVSNKFRITIHKTDKLMLNSLVIHPVVKIHVVDINTGNYFPRSKNTNGDEDYSKFIIPIMTQPYSLQKKRSLIPLWEETIKINENYDYIVEQKENVIIFFELLDFVSMHLINNKTKGWHKIAFSFLKIAGKNNALNFNKNMRLQMYHSSYKKEDVKKCCIWEIWHKGKLTKYPSSLYVSITNCEVPNELLKDTSSKEESDAVQKPEENNVSFPKHWKRKDKELTKLPNECIAQLETEKEGCFTLRFNHSGTLLACSLKLNNVYCITIFSVDTFEQICNLPGHQELIYSIRWSPDDSLIIACSGDCTVSVWNVPQISFLQILPHPTSVYANEITNNIIVTGCYDSKLRIWKMDDNSLKYLLNQELDGHNGFVTSVLFKKSWDTMLSSDSVGVVIEWYKQKNTWVFHKKINVMGLDGITINQIEFIGKEKRLLVHSRDNVLRIIDLKSSIVIHWLQGGLNTRFQTSCSVSPCGNYVIAGSENSSINIWNAKNGKCVGNLIPYTNKNVTIHAVQFHPNDNLIAIGSFGEDLPVLLFGYTGRGEKKIDLKFSEPKIDEKSNNSSSNKNESLKNDKDNYHFNDVLERIDKLMVKRLN